MRNFSIVTCSAVSLFLGILLAGNVRAGGIEEKVTVTPVRSETPKNESLISSTAIKVLRHIAQARADVHAKDLLKAQKELADAQTLILIIKTTVPSEKVKDHIWVANKHLSYENTETVMQDLIPIYASLNDIEDFTVRDKVKKHINNVKNHLEKGNKKGASDELKLAEDTIVLTEIYLPLSDTERQIILAQAHLANKEFKKAEIALKTAEDGVMLISLDDSLPVSQAKISLWQATKNYTAGKTEAAKQDIKKVKENLEKADKTVDAKTKAELDKLSKDIESIEGKLNKFDHETEQELKKLYERTKTII